MTNEAKFLVGSHNKKTKIVCTIGPASWDYDKLKALALAGMDVARLNFSHGSHEEKHQQIQNVRQISAEIGKPIAVLADLQGPKIRLGEIDGKREIKKDQTIQLSLNPTTEELPMQFDLSPFVKKGQRIFLNDGLVELIVAEVKGKTITTKASNDGVVSSHKGVNIPDTKIKEGVFTQKDHEDMEFALKEGVDYIALSFIQTAEDMIPAQILIKKHNSQARIIVKVEKKAAVDNLEAIMKQTQAVMVARGDLAIEIPAAEVPIVQQRMIKLARQEQKPVIIATQMLESMTENPRPTRAEVSDVANAVLDQVDAVMLSAESASGRYPVETVTIMREVIESVEKNLDHKHYIRINWEGISEAELIFNAVNASAASIAYHTKTKVIVVGTVTGRTARILSAFRPDAQIIAACHDEKTRSQLALVWGVTSVIVEPKDNFNDFNDEIMKKLAGMKFLKKNDKIVIITGTATGISGTTNTIKVTTF